MIKKRRRAASERRGPSVLVITNKYTDGDPRIGREVWALLDAGYRVDIICLRRKKEKTSKDLFGAVEGLRRFSLHMDRKRKGKIRYMVEYLVQLLYTFVWTTSLYWRHRHDLIQVFVMPEFLVLSCLIPKLMGAKILMDWEDPMREVYRAKFPHKSRSLFLRMIGLFEKIGVCLADHIFIPNEGFRKAFAKRGVDPNKMTIVMNAPDTKIFKPTDMAHDIHPPTTPPVVLFSGSILERHGLDIAIRAMAKVIEIFPQTRLMIVGPGEWKYLDRCRTLTESLGLTNHVEWRDRVLIHEMPDIIRRTTIGVIPNRNNEFTRINFPTRIMEFALLGRPVVVSRLPGIEDYLDETKVYFFTPGDFDELAGCIIRAHSDPDKTRKLIENAHRWALENGWHQSKKAYLSVVNALSGGPSSQDVSEETVRQNTKEKSEVRSGVG